MRDQYSDTILAIDTGSPVISVAVGRDGRVLAARADSTRGSSATLLRLINETLEEADIDLATVDLLVGLQGPGSFTGLRIGLATLLGLHQARGIDATAVPTFDALALAADEPNGKIATAIDALRGEWFVQLFRGGEPPESHGPPELLRPDQIADPRPAVVVGFGVTALEQADGWRSEAKLIEPGPLAPALVGLAALRPIEIDPARLTAPLYLRPPAATAASS